jgi:hypothetical protein
MTDSGYFPAVDHLVEMMPEEEESHGFCFHS